MKNEGLVCNDVDVDAILSIMSYIGGDPARKTV